MISYRSRSLLLIRNVLQYVYKHNLCTQNSTLPEILNKSAEYKISALQSVSEDLSTISPYTPNSYNIAAYINKSEMLQCLLHLNVDLSKIEKKPYVVEKILRLDFETIKNHLFFLKTYVNTEDIGNFITKNPLILCEPLDHLEIRINYLQSKLFSDNQIKRIITKNPFWLMFSTVRIDKRLGYFQTHLNACGEEIRYLVTKQPNLFTYNLHHIKTNTFVIKEEMGFEENELKQMILSKPKLLMISHKSLLQRFNYIHNVMQIPHTIILSCPGVLLYRNFIIKQRHLFLENLGRAQYNPQRENYVPIIALTEGTDVEFCKKYAKCNVDDFNTFLKTI